MKQFAFYKSIQLAMMISIISWICCWMNASIQAQENMPDRNPISPNGPPSSRSEQELLVEGLLELIPPDDRSKAVDRENSPSWRNDKTTSGSTNPPESAQPQPISLAELHRTMQQIANQLRQGQGQQQTVQLQSQVITQLDAMIAQLEEQRRSRSAQSNQQDDRKPESATKTFQQSVQSDQRGLSSEQTEEAGKQDQASMQADDSAGAQPGRGTQTDRAGNLNLRLNDPVAMQQSAWGHLPERIRLQMQSRMVEQFLPSYREQLEAYYRALLERGVRP